MCSHWNRLYAILMSTHNIPFLNIKKKIILIFSQICNYRNYSKGPKNEFKTAVVNEPSVFEPLKFYYIYMNGPKKKKQQKIVWALIILSFGFSGFIFVNINISDSSICLWFLRSAL